jgi:hypothetical protein
MAGVVESESAKANLQGQETKVAVKAKKQIRLCLAKGKA